MSVNDLSFNQISTVLNSIVGQATGKNVITPTNTSDFVSVAQMGLKTGYDPLLNSISQVLSKTIFSIRPYNRKFRGLEVSNQKYGNITRKLSIADKDFQEDSRIKLVQGESIDMYKVDKPSILQMNYYGANVYGKALTIFRDQLDCAFNSPDEFASFISMCMNNTTEMLEQARESLARMTVANFIGGKIEGDSENVIHLLTEYNAITGLTLTETSVYAPENYKAFIQWAYARIASISSMLTERSEKFHINVTGKEVKRHTPQRMQKVFTFAESRNNIESMVLANTFNDNYLKMSSNEVVNFWQSIDTPDSIDVKPTYLLPTGQLQTSVLGVKQDKIFAVMIDEEALGYTLVNQWSAPTPFNAKGGYSNIFWHETCRYWNDFTENGVIFLLD